MSPRGGHLRVVDCSDRAGLASTSIPAAPTAELLADVHAAGRRAAELAAAGHHLHFTAVPPPGRVIVEVRDAEGRLRGTLTPSELLDVMDGRRDPC